MRASSAYSPIGDMVEIGPAILPNERPRTAVISDGETIKEQPRQMTMDFGSPLLEPGSFERA